jgi:hypothetical protein
MAGSTARYEVEPWAVVYILLMARMGGRERLASAVSAFVCQRGLNRLR